MALSQDRRVPIFTQGAQSDPTGWNWGTIRAISAGGLTIDGDELRFFVTGSSVTTGPLSQTTGVATLRRDGFACLTAVDDGATVLTRPLRFSGGFAFANLVGAMNWTVLAEDGSPLPPFLAANSRAGCVATAGAVNATRCPFSWQAGGSAARLGALAGRVLRFRFDLAGGTELYSFWVSGWASGESGGYVAGGGPTFTSARDLPEAE